VAPGGGPIAAVQEGDTITFDVERRQLNVALDADEIARRVQAYQPKPPRYERGVLAKYAAHVSSAARGAITT
jgi:dihydroxy-acid dehydratase